MDGFKIYQSRYTSQLKSKDKTNQRKSIIILTNSLLEGGSEKQSLLLTEALQKHYNAWLVVFNGEQIGDNLFNYSKQKGIRPFYLNGNLLKKLYVLIQFTKKNKVEIIFSSLATSNLVNAFLGISTGVKYTVGGIRSSWIPKIKLQLQRFLHNYFFTLTICNSYAGENYLISNKFKSRKIKVIPNFIDSFPNLITRERCDTVNILSIGRFHESKDYLTTLRAIKLLDELNLNFEYRLIGFGVLKKQIQNWIKELFLEEKVNVIINPNNINDYYKEADIFLQTSIYEGLPNSIMEAMAFSLPVVATDVGDNGRLIIDNRTGFLCPIKNVNKIASNLKQLINDYQMRIEFGKYGYLKVKSEYNVELFSKRYFYLIESFN